VHVTLRTAAAEATRQVRQGGGCGGRTRGLGAAVAHAGQKGTRTRNTRQRGVTTQRPRQRRSWRSSSSSTRYRRTINRHPRNNPPPRRGCTTATQDHPAPPSTCSSLPHTPGLGNHRGWANPRVQVPHSLPRVRLGPGAPSLQGPPQKHRVCCGTSDRCSRRGKRRGLHGCGAEAPRAAAVPAQPPLGAAGCQALCDARRQAHHDAGDVARGHHLPVDAHAVAAHVPLQLAP
jgi:hypothetical protein